MVRIGIFGAAPDTPNMGVTALFISTVSGIARNIDQVEFVVFDNGEGRRTEPLELPDGKILQLVKYGARGGRRYYRAGNLLTMLVASRLGKLGALVNEGVRLIDSCDAVLDISGGDSFSDIYGWKRFNIIYRSKRTVLNRGIPLILLPQTYGPYNDPRAKKLASEIMHEASMAWARDDQSYKILKDMLMSDFDPGRHFSGVDVAFSLEPINALQLLDDKLQYWIRNAVPEIPLVGLNLNGLIYNDPEGARTRYGFKSDYREIVTEFITRVLEDTPARILLVPHVMAAPGHYESDLAACQDVMSRLDERYVARVQVSPISLNQSQVKWLISRMDWFCGTRMHSTIAALSSGVPTATISYSDKTLGVFATCGQAGYVFDPRRHSKSKIVNGLIGAFENRSAVAPDLKEKLLNVSDQAELPVEMIAKYLQSNCANPP